MPAFVIAEIEITDPDRYANYVRQVPATIAAHGGTYRARGGTAELLEGAGEAVRTIVLEFPSIEHVRNWWNSPEYEPLKAIRRSASTGRVLMVEGRAET